MVHPYEINILDFVKTVLRLIVLFYQICKLFINKTMCMMMKTSMRFCEHFTIFSTIAMEISKNHFTAPCTNSPMVAMVLHIFSVNI